MAAVSDCINSHFALTCSCHCQRQMHPTPYVSTLCLPDVTAHDQLILQAIIKYHRQEQPGNEANSVHCLCVNFHWKKKTEWVAICASLLS